MKILLVDDSRTQRRIQKNILIQNNIPEVDIYEAANGKEALALMNNDNFDLIILDWNMPELNGIDFMRKIRQVEKWTEIPVIMVTSEAEKRYLLAAIEAGVTNYIAKPVSARVFWEKVSKYIE